MPEFEVCIKPVLIQRCQRDEYGYRSEQFNESESYVISNSPKYITHREEYIVFPRYEKSFTKAWLKHEGLAESVTKAWLNLVMKAWLNLVMKAWLNLVMKAWLNRYEQRLRARTSCLCVFSQT